jgi:predicted membrane protein
MILYFFCVINISSLLSYIRLYYYYRIIVFNCDFIFLLWFAILLSLFQTYIAVHIRNKLTNSKEKKTKSQLEHPQ